MDALSNDGRDIQKTVYDHKAPPPSMEAAEQRMLEVMAKATDIEVQLEFKDPKDFADPSEYEHWRRRAMKALGYRRRESNFLEQWLARERKKSGASIVPANAQMMPQHIAPLLAIAERMAREMRERYVPRYADATPPPSIVAAQTRLNELKGVNAALERCRGDLKLEGVRLGFSHGQCTLARAPLDAFGKELGVELSAVRSYITNVVQSDRAEPDWKDVCADAITRAASEGFKLTEREQVVLDRLMRRRQTPTDA